MGIGVLLIHSEIGVTAVKVVVGVSRIERFRTCTDPPPSDGGNSCVGEAIDSEEQKCNIEECLSKCQISIVVTL